VDCRSTSLTERRPSRFSTPSPENPVCLPELGDPAHPTCLNDRRTNPAADTTLTCLADGDYLARYGFPIRYKYVKQAWPGEYYQTVYATEPGSAEMPSAGRAFTPELITRLVAKGVQIAPLILHTGVASLEKHEPPYEDLPHAAGDRPAGQCPRRANGCRSAQP
jgi:hypothetical protein